MSFVATLNQTQQEIVQALIDGVAFLNCDIRTGNVPMYTVFSHEGDDIGVFTQHDLESVIHRAKRMGYGYYKLTGIPGISPVGLTFKNYGPLHGIWTPGMLVGESKIPVLQFRIGT